MNETSEIEPGLSSIKVHELDDAAFAAILSSNLQETTLVNVNDWKEADTSSKVLNKGAGPCLIVYFINKSTGECVSGHFSDVDKERNDRFTREALDRAKKAFAGSHQGIVIPTESQVSWLSPTDAVPEYAKLEEMEKHMVDKIASWGKDNVEVHLFGQNPIIYGDGSEKAQRTVDDAIEHNNFTIRVREQGVSDTNIHDHRSLTTSGVDHTLYDSQKKTIYHYKKLKKKL